MAEAKKTTKKVTKTKATKKVTPKTTPVISEPVETPVTNPVKKPKTWVYIAIGVLVFLFLALLAGKHYVVVATVNGKPIFWYQYMKSLENQGGQQVLDQLILAKLVTDEATKNGITVSQSDIDQEMSTVTKNLVTKDKTLEQALSEQGLTVAEVQNRIKLNKMVTELASKDVTVSAQEVTDYLTKNKSLLPTGKDTPSNLNQLVADQLLKTKQQEAIQSYLDNLKKAAVISYW